MAPQATGTPGIEHAGLGIGKTSLPLIFIYLIKLGLWVVSAQPLLYVKVPYFFYYFCNIVYAVPTMDEPSGSQGMAKPRTEKWPQAVRKVTRQHNVAR